MTPIDSGAGRIAARIPGAAAGDDPWGPASALPLAATMAASAAGIAGKGFPLGSGVGAWLRLPFQVPLVVWATSVARRARS